MTVCGFDPLLIADGYVLWSCANIKLLKNNVKLLLYE